ncbi:GMC oxidoreductase [Rasiella sp. SM2506]|uniref:GMC oxidoreductase n=1 Tax=Rasiella sp. SM2506 TaxID=3423914 RepID=UPI003D7AB34A
MLHKTEVLIIGSGFGASVAALRFAEVGKKVTILERGGWITRENFEADDDMLWQPKNGRYGMNDFKMRGKNIIPWLGAGVGGGSHVYAATLKRRDFFDDFPGNISASEMTPYYERAEKMMQAVTYPEYPPYSNLPSYCIFREAEKELSKERPDIVEKQGNILLGISYAPKNGIPGAKFINSYGAEQRYSDPKEQKILGGEIDVKNTLDKNYLFEAQKKGAQIIPFREVTKIEPLEGGGYNLHWNNPKEDSRETGMISCDILICGAGAIGSTQLLLQNKAIHKTLPNISETLGNGYFTNGDFVTFLLPKRGFLISWIGVVGALATFIFGHYVFALGFAILYILGWALSGKKAEPDKGTTNSDYIRFKHRDGSAQGVYIEGGRYPTPIKAITAIILSLTGNFKPKSYKIISDTVNWMGKYIPVFELIQRSWPIPILMMGRDDAEGHFFLDDKGEAKINYNLKANDAYYAHLNKLGKLFSKKAKSFYIPNGVAALFKIVEVPHNIGGASMGVSKEKGVVDTFGRMYGYDNFMVLDGSILPKSLGPNPALTILAFSERGVEQAIHQMNTDGKITAESKNIH